MLIQRQSLWVFVIASAALLSASACHADVLLGQHTSGLELNGSSPSPFPLLTDEFRFRLGEFIGNQPMHFPAPLTRTVSPALQGKSIYFDAASENFDLFAEFLKSDTPGTVMLFFDQPGASPMLGGGSGIFKEFVLAPEDRAAASITSASVTFRQFQVSETGVKFKTTLAIFGEGNEQAPEPVPLPPTITLLATGALTALAWRRLRVSR